MGFFSKKKEKKEDQENVVTSRKVNPVAPMYQNRLICNACGKEITNTPKFFNLNGRKMIFHKSCFKKLRQGNINL
jgi:hypothetical protein